MNAKNSASYKEAMLERLAQSTLVKLLLSEDGRIYTLTAVADNDWIKNLKLALQQNPSGVRSWFRGRYETVVHIEELKGHG